MVSPAGADADLLAPAALPEVVVLGSGGLARRLAVGPLCENGLVVHEADEAPPGGTAPVVGLLVNPSTEHWAAAVARRLPLVLLLLDQPTDEVVIDAVLRGADAVVSAHDEPEVLVAAITGVAAGGTLLTPRQVRWITDAARGRRRDAGAVDPLTGRELDILLSIDRGETVKQTARSLGISAKTVENLQSRLFRKLAVRNRAQAVSRAHALGLLSVGAGPETAVSADLSVS